MKPLILMLHGLGSSHLAFEALRAELASLETTCEIVAPNYYGFGGVPVPPGIGRVSIPVFARQVAELIRARGGERDIHLLAHSMSGAVALELIRQEPSLPIRTFLNIEGNLHNDPAATSVMVSKTPREEFVRKGFAQLDRATRILATQGDPGAVNWLKSIQLTTAEVFYDAAVDLVRASATAYDAYRDWPGKSAYLFGENTLKESEGARSDREKLARDDKRVEIVPNAWHSVMVDNPAECARIFRALIT